MKHQKTIPQGPAGRPPAGPDQPAPKPAAARRDPDELELVRRLKLGQEWAFNRLVSLYQERLLKVAYSITMDREESLEVVQDVFVSVYKSISGYRQEAGLWGWLRRITINHCLNWKRKWKRRFRWHHRPIESDHDPGLKGQGPDLDPESLVREKQMETRLAEAVKGLSEKNRLVFVLSTFEGLSYQEIGDMLKIKKGTVSSRLFAARSQIMDRLKE